MGFQNEKLIEVREKTINAAKGAKKGIKHFIRGTVLPLIEKVISEKRITEKGEKRPENHP